MDVDILNIYLKMVFQGVKEFFRKKEKSPEWMSVCSKLKRSRIGEVQEIILKKTDDLGVSAVASHFKEYKGDPSNKNEFRRYVMHDEKLDRLCSGLTNLLVGN